MAKFLHAGLMTVVGWTSNLLQISCCKQNAVCLRIASEEVSCSVTSALRCVLHSEGSFENFISIEGQANLQLVVKEIDMDAPKLMAATNSCAFGGTIGTVLSQCQSSHFDVLAPGQEPAEFVCCFETEKIDVPF